MKEELPLSIETLRTLQEEDVLALDPAKLSARDIRSIQRQVDKRRPKNSPFASLKDDLKTLEIEALLKSRAEERWKQYFTDVAFSKHKYRIDQRELVRLAKQRPRKGFSTAVTGFTGWIYDLYAPKKTSSKLNGGRAAENKISQIKGAPPPEKNGWDLVYDDISGIDPPAKKISSLTLNGKPLYGKPDLVFKERSSGNILILELKYTNAEVPLDGWPNLRAQLWAYSQIDDWRDAPEIHLAAEIWAGSIHTPIIKASRSWDSCDSSLIADNEELFRLYGGHVG